MKIETTQTKKMLELITLEYSLADASFITQIEQRCSPRDDETMHAQRTATTGNCYISCQAKIYCLENWKQYCKENAATKTFDTNYKHRVQVITLQ